MEFLRTRCHVFPYVNNHQRLISESVLSGQNIVNNNQNVFVSNAFTATYLYLQ
jgi:hypothetical protein